jgi:hypothetical protein
MGLLVLRYAEAPICGRSSARRPGSLLISSPRLVSANSLRISATRCRLPSCVICSACRPRIIVTLVFGAHDNTRHQFGNAMVAFAGHPAQWAMLARHPELGAQAAEEVLAQDAPLYAGLLVADHLKLGAHLNPGWDAELARRRIEWLGLDPKQKAGTLSGGQRAQLALSLAVAKRPELLILDEPVLEPQRCRRPGG